MDAARVDRLIDSLLRLSVLVVVGLSVGLIVWTVPTADDFCGGYYAGSYGQAFRSFFPLVSYVYHSWGGRWAAVALDLLIYPLITSSVFAGYSWAVGAIFCACCVAFYGLIRILLGTAISRKRAAMLAAAGFAIYWTGVPLPGGTLYWLPAAVEYVLPLPLVVAVAWLMLRSEAAENQSRRVGYTAGACLVVFLTTGLHELAATAVTVWLATISFVLLVFLPSQAKKGWMVVTLTAAAGTIVSVSAPGNAVRLHTEFGAFARHWTSVIHVISRQAMVYWLPWLFSPRLVAASAILATTPWFHQVTSRWPAIGARPKWLLSATFLSTPFLIWAIVAGTLVPLCQIRKTTSCSASMRFK